MISIPPDWRTYLAGKPEYGMGYQKAQVHYQNGSYEVGFIFNGSFCSISILQLKFFS